MASQGIGVELAYDKPAVAAPQSTGLGGVLATFLAGAVLSAALMRMPSAEAGVLLAVLSALGAMLFAVNRFLAPSDARLRNGEMSYRAFFDHAIEGIFRTTPDGHYVDANPALARIYGYASPEHLMAGLTNIADQLYVDPARRAEMGAAARRRVREQFGAELMAQRTLELYREVVAGGAGAGRTV